MAPDAGGVLEQQLELDDDPWAQLLARYVSLVWSMSLIWHTNLLNVLSLMYDFGKRKLRKSWDKMKVAWRGGDNADADLINFLTNRYLTDFFSLEKSRKVLCIVGPSRRDTDEANKTAIRLYRDTKNDFTLSKHVELPEGPADSAKILGNLLGGGNLARQDIIDGIKKALKGKRYLILIRDLRDVKTWEEIESAFPDNRMCSGVIITTSRMDVAEECFSGKSDLIYKLRTTKHTTGAGPADGHAHASAEDEGSGYFTAEDGEGRAEDDDDDDTVGTLLSECTDDLRDCSLYLSTVGDVFERASMVWKWVAEGIVLDEKMGHDHFLELFSRDVIQAEQKPSKFRAEPGYVVNRRMLSGLRRKSQEANFAAHVDADSAEDASNHPVVTTPTNNKITRLSLSCRGPSSTRSSTSQPLAGDGGAVKPETTTFFKMRFSRRKETATTEADKKEQPRDNLLGHARSMTVRGHGKGLLKELDRGQQLLVLDLQGCEDLSNSDVVYICGRLTHLKYLSINGTPVSDIPPDIKNLQDLQTLDLRETKVAVLPPEIRELPRLAHLLVSDWLKMTAEKQQGNNNGMMDFHLLLGVGVLDIRICHLETGDLEKLGSMIHLRSLALTLTGLPTQEMVITKELLFGKLQVLALDCHVPWITFREGAMPELRRLYLWLYAGPRGKTPSGTNHLKKLHEVTLRYTKQYQASACVRETTRAMEEQGSMRARPTTFVINEEVKVPMIQVPSYYRQTLGRLVRKLMRGFYDYIITLLLPFASKLLRPYLSQMNGRQLGVVLPLLALFFYYQVTLLIMLAPLLLKVAIMLARMILHLLLVDFLFSECGLSDWDKFVTTPLAAYHMFCFLTPVYYYLSPAVLLVCAALFWFPSLLMRLALLYILSPLWHILPTVFSVLAPLVISLVLIIGLLRHVPSFLPHMPTNVLVVSLIIVAVWYYFLPTLLYSAVNAVPIIVRIVAEWFVYGS